MTEIWKAVKEFLVSSKVESSWEKVTDLRSLYDHIRDGKILCDILNVIIGYNFCNAIKSKQYHEVRIFLKSASRSFKYRTIFKRV